MSYDENRTDNKTEVLPLETELVGLAATISPVITENSSPRMQMTSSHMSQQLAVKNPDLPTLMTGFEKQLGNFTYDIRVPFDCIVQEVIRKDNDPNFFHPITIIISNAEGGKYDYIEIKRMEKRHRTFGAIYKIQPIVDTLRKGSVLRKGTLLATNPMVEPETKAFCFGVNANILATSSIGTIEDGYEVSESLTHRAALTMMGESVLMYGKKDIATEASNRVRSGWNEGGAKGTFPLNIFGTDEDYKFVPNVGESVGPSGLLFATRNISPLFEAADLLPHRLRRVDVTDTPHYIQPNAIVEDISAVDGGSGKESGKGNNFAVFKEDFTTPRRQVMQLTARTERYHASLLHWLTSERKALKDKRLHVRFSPQLNRLMTDSIGVNKDYATKLKDKTKNAKLTFKNRVIDGFRLNISWSAERNLRKGDKITGKAGNKGVITRVKPDSEMYCDSHGNYSDVNFNGRGTTARLNTGQMTDYYLSAAARTTTDEVKDMFKNNVDAATIFARLLEFYEAASPTMAEVIKHNYVTPEQQADHVNAVVNDKVRILGDAADPEMGIRRVPEVAKVSPPPKGKLRYVEHGQMMESADDAIIGSGDIMVLEKSDYISMAVSASRRQHHGLIAGTSKMFRASSPYKIQSTWVNGVTETRMALACMGQEYVNEILTQANNPEMCKDVCRAILRNPGKMMVDYKISDKIKQTNGTSRALELTKDILNMAGIDLVPVKTKGK